MARDSVTLDKSKNFAIRIVRLYQYLCTEKKEFVLSDKDFLSKMYISLKECAETKYWLDLLFKTDYLTEQQYRSINEDCTELIKLLTSSAKTMSIKLKSNN